jgi:hypothetical protein
MLAHEFQVLRAVERTQFLVRGRTRLAHLHAPVKPTCCKLARERGVPVRAERMPIAEAVASQALAAEHRDIGRIGGGFYGCSPRSPGA